jgi:hypothetical protein
MLRHFVLNTMIHGVNAMIHGVNIFSIGTLVLGFALFQTVYSTKSDLQSFLMMAPKLSHLINAFVVKLEKN